MQFSAFSFSSIPAHLQCSPYGCRSWRSDTTFPLIAAPVFIPLIRALESELLRDPFTLVPISAHGRWCQLHSPSFIFNFFLFYKLSHRYFFWFLKYKTFRKEYLHLSDVLLLAKWESEHLRSWESIHTYISSLRQDRRLHHPCIQYLQKWTTSSFSFYQNENAPLLT